MSVCLHALCKQTVDEGKVAMFLAISSYLHNFRAHFANVFFMTHLPGLRRFDCQTFPLSCKHTEKCKKLMCTHKRTHKFNTTDNLYPYTHTQTNIIILIITALRGKHLFLFGWYLRAEDKHFPFPCTSPWSCRHCSVGRNDLLDGDGPSVSPITKPTDLWHHRWRQSNKWQQQRPIDKFVSFKLHAALGPFLKKGVFWRHFDILELCLGLSTVLRSLPTEVRWQVNKKKMKRI